MKFRQAIFFVLIFSFGCGGNAAVDPTPPPSEPTGVIQSLIDFLNQQDKINIKPEDYDSTSLGQLMSLATPAGYRIKLRYRWFGFALVEALRVARDGELKRRLIEMAQWSREPKVRAEAIVTLASLSDPTHIKYFKSALLDHDVNIQFAGIEALQVWGQPQALSLIQFINGRAWSPLVKLFSAQALLSMGDESGLAVLWKGLDDSSWVVRAMSAHYLGDYANPEDYTKIATYLNQESRNDYVKAELCIAALKLISRKDEKVSYSPASKGWRDNEEVKYTLGKGGVVEVEPLVIVPPRLHIPKSLQVAAKINNELLDLIRNKLGVQLDPEQANDPVLIELNGLQTPTGFSLQMRYSDLSYLVIEGLAGTTDLLLQSELEKLVTDSKNGLVRGSALLALAYTRDPRFIFLIQDALKDKEARVRFAAMEAIEVGRYKDVLPSLNFVEGEDTLAPLQVQAIQIFAKFGDETARYQLISHTNDTDWPGRAMAYWYLGRFGDKSDYTYVLSRLGTEQNPFVKAEIVLAALRLAPL